LLLESLLEFPHLLWREIGTGDTWWQTKTSIGGNRTRIAGSGGSALRQRPITREGQRQHRRRQSPHA
jgi:hypothetical protein